MKIELKNPMSEFKKERILSSIIELLKRKNMSIADIQRATKIKRSTLIYYLQQLESQHYVTKKRIEEEITGRPTIFKLNKEKLRADRKIFNKRKTELQKTKKELLKTIEEKKNVTEKELFSIFPKKSFSDIFSILLFLEQEELIKRFYKPTNKGKQFLKKNAKSIN